MFAVQAKKKLVKLFLGSRENGIKICSFEISIVWTELVFEFLNQFPDLCYKANDSDIYSNDLISYTISYTISVYPDIINRYSTRYRDISISYTISYKISVYADIVYRYHIGYFNLPHRGVRASPRHLHQDAPPVQL